MALSRAEHGSEFWPVCQPRILAVRNNEDRALGVMEHPIRGGSKEHARETTPATRTQDNELHAPPGLNQHVDW